MAGRRVLVAGQLLQRVAADVGVQMCGDRKQLGEFEPKAMNESSARSFPNLALST